jgi:nucleotide-binding universal stress UspA family protein
MNVILVALDASPRAPGVLAAALAAARQQGARLVLLRVAHLPVDLPVSMFTISTDAPLALLTEECKRQLAELSRGVPPELLVDTVVRAGAPWEVICAEAKHRDASLIIIGAHGYGRLERFAGTTAARVIDHADRSVLVVRER